MRVLVIHRYFWPDTPPYGWMLRAIAGRWADDGHDVTVLTSQPSYNATMRGNKQPRIEDLDGFTVRRVGLFPESKRNFLARGLNLGLFMLRIFAHIATKRHGYDVVMAATTPPVMVAWAASLAARLRGARFVYHCQDIHPEMMDYAGLLEPGMTYRFLKARDTATVNRARRVVVLSRDMAATLEQRDGVAQPRIDIINNFTVPEYSEVQNPDVPDAVRPEGRFRVLFAGNLGYFQGLEAVIDAAHLLRDIPAVEFVFLGEGAAKTALVEQAGDLVGSSVHFLGYRPQAEAEAFVRNADLSLITLGPDIYRVAYPSKTMTYLKQGSPILAMIEPASELAQMITTRQIGYVSPPGDAVSIADHVRAACGSASAVEIMRNNARQTCEELFSEASRLALWSALLRDQAFPREPQPVFVIGAGRSGTKFLRDVLGAAQDVAAVPYDIGYVWRTGNEKLDHDELPPDSLTRETRSYIRRTLPKLAGVDERSRVLVEKSVPNSLRVPFLSAVFPQARFVHLVRDGRAVVESSMRQWQAPAESSYLLRKLRYFPWSNYRYAFWYIGNQLKARFANKGHIWGPRYAGMEQDAQAEPLETVCARQWRVCVEKAVYALADLPGDRVLTLRYEDLVADESAVARVCEFAGIEDSSAVLDYYRANVRAQALEKWHQDLSEDQRRAVLEEIGPLLAELGYSP